MRKDIEKHQMTGDELFWLAYRTCQWWNAVIIQAKRFLDVLSDDHGGIPWNNDKNCMFVAERMFLITAVYHAIVNLQKLNIELKRDSDTSMEIVLDELEKIVSFEKIKNLRDMNEHDLDDLVKKGQKQQDFLSSVEKNGVNIITSAAWTHVYNDEEMILLGNVEIDKLLLVMKNQLPFVSNKTKEIFDKGMGGTL